MNRTEYSSIRLRNLAVALFGGMLLAVSAVGCSESESQGDIAATGSTTGDVVSENGTVPVSLLLMADGRLTVSASDASATRAVTVRDSAVNDVWVLQFDTSSSAAGKLVHRAFVSQGIRQNGTNVKVPVMLIESTNCVVVVVANSPETLDAETLPDGSTLDDLRTRTFDVTSTKGESLPSDTSVFLPMYGESASMAVSLVGSTSISVNLTRLVSCIELSVRDNDFHTYNTYPYLQLGYAVLHNVPTEIAYSPLTASATHMGTVFPAAKSDNFRDYEYEHTFFDYDDDGDIDEDDIYWGYTINRKWYMAPNRRGKGTATTSDDKTAFTAPAGQGNYCTYISIHCKVKYSSDTDYEYVVYNLWLGSNSTDDYNLWANGYYKINLTITGFNDNGEIEVGYDGINVNIGDWDALSDNTITGWHPDTGLEYIPNFVTFSPDRIDFGNAEAPDAQKVTFRVNSGWRFSYTSGDAAKVIASSSVAANANQTGGAQGEPAQCEVSFTPVAYHAQSGTPAAGTQYSTVATFTTVGGALTDTRTTVFIRTVPTIYGEPSVSPSSGPVARAGATVTATMSSNAGWSVSATPGTSAAQVADSYASRSKNVTISANNTWQSRTVKVAVQYGDKKKEWSYTQPGMSITNASVSPDPTGGIRSTGDRFAVTINGDFGSVPVRAISGSTVLSSAYATPGGPTVLSVPANQSTTEQRTVSFQYQQNGVCKTIKSGIQDHEAIDVPECPLTDIGLDFYISRSVRYQCIVVFWDNVKAHCEKFGYRMPNMNEVRQIYENRNRLTGEFVLTNIGGVPHTDGFWLSWSCYVSDQRNGVIDVRWGWTVWDEFGKGRGVDDSRCVKDKK